MNGIEYDDAFGEFEESMLENMLAIVSFSGYSFQMEQPDVVKEQVNLALIVPVKTHIEPFVLITH